MGFCQGREQHINGKIRSFILGARKQLYMAVYYFYFFIVGYHINIIRLYLLHIFYVLHFHFRYIR